jgi:5,10-methenyltetrahydrofolate synthetase
MTTDLKKELRKFALKNSNTSFTPSQESLNDFIDVISNKSICTYLPLKNEININSFLNVASDVSVLADVFNKITITRLTEPFDVNKFGVKQPSNIVEVNHVDIFLVPGLAFDLGGNRLGRGAGYYDKLLVNYPKSIKIGIANNSRIIDAVPTEDHDVAMDSLFTPENYISISIE